MTKLLFLTFWLVTRSKIVDITLKKYAAKALKAKNFVYLLLHKTLCIICIKTNVLSCPSQILRAENLTLPT